MTDEVTIQHPPSTFLPGMQVELLLVPKPEREPSIRAPGNRTGVVDRVIYCRGMSLPKYSVIWEIGGEIYGCEFHEEDLELAF